MITGLGDGEGEVSIIAWEGYIERGESDPAYDWVTEFENQTQCKVTVKTVVTSDEMWRLMNETGFDLVIASGDISNILIAESKVQPINIELIPSWTTVDERLQNAPWHTVEDVHYGVPYQWAPHLLMYNTNVFPEDPSSWNVTFEEMTLPDGQSNKGRVQAYGAPIYIAEAALYLKYHNPDLGIDNPYDLTQEQFAAVMELLTRQRELIHRYWRDVFIQMDDFQNEGVVASGSWPLQVNLLRLEGAPIAAAFPVEGMTGWADSTMLHAAAPHPNCAYKWLEWSLDPRLQGDVAAWYGSVPAVPAACSGNELLTNAGCLMNGFEQFDRIWFWRTPTAECSTGKGGCVPYDQWVESYTAIIGQ
jgi:putative spermidine/putrescine transport system substrate-binding protein